MTRSPALTATNVGASLTEDVSSGLYYSELTEITATRSGSTAKCTVTIPYAWSLACASSDTVSLSLQILASGGTSGVVTRDVVSALASIKVPASGATTTETVDVTL